MVNQTPDTGPITLINVFEIRGDDVELFLQEWRERAEFLGGQPGFRSLRLHRALNPDSRFQLVNVAEWDSAEALQAATSQDFFQQSTQRSMQDSPLPPTPRSTASSSKPPRTSDAETVSSRPLRAIQQRRDAIAHPRWRQDRNVRRFDGARPQDWATGERPASRVSPRPTMTTSLRHTALSIGCAIFAPRTAGPNCGAATQPRRSPQSNCPPNKPGRSCASPCRPGRPAFRG